MTTTTSRRAAVAVAGASVLVAGAVPLLVAGPASADDTAERDKQGSCSDDRARYDFDVEKDDGRYEASFEVESNVRGQQWRLTLKHEGKRVFRDVRRTDREGEADYDRNRPDTPRKDTFRARAVHLGNGEVCTVRIVRR